MFLSSYYSGKATITAKIIKKLMINISDEELNNYKYKKFI